MDGVESCIGRGGWLDISNRISLKFCNNNVPMLCLLYMRVKKNVCVVSETGIQDWVLPCEDDFVAILSALCPLASDGEEAHYEHYGKDGCCQNSALNVVFR